MQSTCRHVCHCGNATRGEIASQSSHLPATHSSSAGEWIWTAKQNQAAPLTSSNYISPSTSNLSTAPYQSGSNVSFEPCRQGPADVHDLNVVSAVDSALLPRSEDMNAFWKAAGFVGMEDAMMGMGIDFDMPLTVGTTARFVDAYPVSPHDAPSITSLLYSPLSAGVLDTSTSTSTPSTATPASPSFGSTPSVPATPTISALLELDALLHPSTVDPNSSVKQHHESPNMTNSWTTRLIMQGPASRSDLAAFPATPNALSPSMMPASGNGTPAQQYCSCSGSRAPSCTASCLLPTPTHVAIPARGWLDPNMVPIEMALGVSTSTRCEREQGATVSGSWSDLVSQDDSWNGPATAPTMTACARYEPYQNASVASTSSASSQMLASYSQTMPVDRSALVETLGGRRRSLTTGSVSGAPSSLVDRVRVMNVARPHSPTAQQLSVPSSPRLAMSTKYKSMPRLRARPSVLALSTAFSHQASGTGSIKEKATASSCSRAALGSGVRRPLSGLFALQGPGPELASPHRQSSPTLSELTQGLHTPPMSLFFGVPPAPLSDTFSDATPVDMEHNDEATMGAHNAEKPKVAVHHHRTKMQRNVLNEAVTSLDGACRHHRRQMPAGDHDAFSALFSELGHLDTMQDLGQDDCTAENDPTIVIAGETREMRKNRQKAESKMRMRRKEVAQFAALTIYARTACRHFIVNSSSSCCCTQLAQSLAEVFLELRPDWPTLLALEKRLFHTARLKLGLQELFVRKVIELLSTSVPLSA